MTNIETVVSYREYFSQLIDGDAVEAADVEVVNCTPDSAILSSRRPLSEVLAE
jgi:hypothetical protein